MSLLKTSPVSYVMPCLVALACWTAASPHSALPRGQSSWPLKPVQAAETPSADTPSRDVIAQKLKLLEAYLKAPSARRVAESDHDQAKALLGEAHRMLEDARRAFAGEDRSTAAALLDDGLRSLTAASALLPRPGATRSQDDERAGYAQLRGQIDSYLHSLSEAMSVRRVDAGLHSATARIKDAVNEASRAAQDGQFRRANHVLAGAYRDTVALISELRQGETVVSSLTFETAEEEFAYELRRNDSYEILVEIMVQQDSGASDDLRALTERFVSQSRSARAQAEAKASAEDHGSAIEDMERATGFLVRALRAGGLYVPE